MKPETEHVIQIIRSAMRVLGFTNREVERRLGVSGGYLTRLFSGVMELRFEHIVDIARAIGLEPQELFELIYPQPRKRPPMRFSASGRRSGPGSPWSRRSRPRRWSPPRTKSLWKRSSRGWSG